MNIRAGILHIPTVDHAAADAVRYLLHYTLEKLFIQEEQATADQRYVLEEMLRIWSDERELDLIITIGATYLTPGPSSLGSVPDATQSVIERTIPGIAEAMRSYAQQQSALAYLDRSIAGIRGRTLIINLPAGAAPAHLFLEAVVDLISPTIAHLREEKNIPRLADVLSLEIVGEEAEHSGGGTPFEANDEQEENSESSHKLDPAEFQQFLQRQGLRKSRNDD